jgi:hypothetical protein
LNSALRCFPRAAAKPGFWQRLGRCLPSIFPGVACRLMISAAQRDAEIVALRTCAGRPISVEDAQIAAIAVSNGLSLATRNEVDFELIQGLVRVNPWRE